MQPTIICTAPVPGLIYLNGHFAGEASAERPLYMPAAPWGAVYIEYRPLASPCPPMACKCVFSGGRAIPDSLAEAHGVSAAAWPGNILELEFTPEQQSSEYFLLENMPCLLTRSGSTTLSLGNLRLNLPEKALPPRINHLHSCPILSGEIEGGGQYIITLDRNFSRQTGYLSADRIDPEGQDMLRAIIHSGDIAGHAWTESWQIAPDGLRQISSQPAWTYGVPRQPRSAEETMLAAMEAALLGFTDEAESFLEPRLRGAALLAAFSESWDVCMPMKYALPGAGPCIGLMKMENARFAAVHPLYYQASPCADGQRWEIHSISQ